MDMDFDWDTMHISRRDIETVDTLCSEQMDVHIHELQSPYLVNGTLISIVGSECPKHLLFYSLLFFLVSALVFLAYRLFHYCDFGRLHQSSSGEEHGLKHSGVTDIIVTLGERLPVSRAASRAFFTDAVGIIDDALNAYILLSVNERLKVFKSLEYLDLRVSALMDDLKQRSSDGAVCLHFRLHCADMVMECCDFIVYTKQKLNFLASMDSELHIAELTIRLETQLCLSERVGVPGDISLIDNEMLRRVESSTKVTHSSVDEYMVTCAASVTKVATSQSTEVFARCIAGNAEVLRSSKIGNRLSEILIHVWIAIWLIYGILYPYTLVCNCRTKSGAFFASSDKDYTYSPTLSFAILLIYTYAWAVF
jgi:hypothetical protein